jgi:hypothetical protein
VEQSVLKPSSVSGKEGTLTVDLSAPLGLFYHIYLTQHLMNKL